ncbi:hypothetical protein OC845_003663 [Tilletia horrida]|nr:hypothetical protein OC845_003663 [Tilletia horrida]
MGVKNLWEELDAAAAETTLEVLSLSAFLHDGKQLLAGSGPSSLGKAGAAKRHLVLGIDASIWLFHAMTMTKTAGGHSGEVRMLFFRLAKLHALPIIPIFVFDGPKRPSWKRSKQRPASLSNSRYSFPHQRDFEHLIHIFGFAVHFAPAEAEAQLAKMNMDGVIDAVLTDDVDAFLFGARVVLRNSSKTLSGSKARANRAQQLASDSEHDDDDDEETQARPSSPKKRTQSKGKRPAASSKGKKGRRTPTEEKQSDIDGSDSELSSTYAPSSTSDRSDTPEASNKKKGKDTVKDPNALQGKLEDTHTVYRSFLIMDESRSDVDKRAFSRHPHLTSTLRPAKEQPRKALDRDGLILTALLSGGDYDMQGRDRCGIKIALGLARCGFGKRLITAYKRRFQPPAHASNANNSQQTSSEAAWNRELDRWVQDVRNELRTNESGQFDRRFPTLASSSVWDSFLQTSEQLEVVQSYVWPHVKSVTLQQVMASSREHHTGSRGPRSVVTVPSHSDKTSAFIGIGNFDTTNDSVQLDTHPSSVIQTELKIQELCQFMQFRFNWEPISILKRFESLVWDGCVIRRAISMVLHLDSMKDHGDEGLSIKDIEAKAARRPRSPSSPKSRRKSSGTSKDADVTITPQARRFADFFEKSVNVVTPSRPPPTSSKLGQSSRDHHTATKGFIDGPSSGIAAGTIDVLGIHGVRQHAQYGGITSEVRIEYSTDGLKQAVESGFATDHVRGENGGYEPMFLPQDDLDDAADSPSNSEPASIPEEDEESDEFITLSQVKAKEKAKNKINAKRLWIPAPFIENLPAIVDPREGPVDIDNIVLERSPMLLLKAYRDRQKAKEEKKRLKAQNKGQRGPRTAKSKLGDPEAGQLRLDSFFSASTAKGKGRERELTRMDRQVKTSNSAASSGSWSSTSKARAAGAADDYRDKTPPPPTRAKLNIPARYIFPQSPSSGSENSVIMLNTPPKRIKVPNEARVLQDEATTEPGFAAADIMPHQLSQSSILSSSDFDELVDETQTQRPMVSSTAPSAVTSTFRPAVLLRGSRAAQTKPSSEASEDEDEEADDSLPDIMSASYTQAQSQHRHAWTAIEQKNTPASLSAPAARVPKTRAASTSSEESGKNGAGPSAESLQRSPKKSPRKNKEQAQVWSTNARASSPCYDDARGTGDHNSMPDMVPSKPSRFLRMRGRAVQDDEADSESDEETLDATRGRPGSPSPLPRRFLASIPVESHDTSASFEIVGERRAFGGGVDGGALVLEDSD